MSSTIQISDPIAHYLQILALGQSSDINQKLRSLLETEYGRRLTHSNRWREINTAKVAPSQPVIAWAAARVKVAGLGAKAPSA